MKTKLFIKKNKFLIVSILFFTTNVYSFNFLVNILYSILPQPVRSAFKGEGLQIDQFEYGFGNCNFLSFGYLNSNLQYTSGEVINEKIIFSIPTFYLYGIFHH